MTNKRRAPRRDTVIYLRITDAGSGKEIGRLADVSDTGILIVSNAPLPTGERIAVQIHLPPHLMEGGETELSVEIEPRWSRPDKNPSLLLNGCVLYVDAERAPILSVLIERFGFNNDTIDFRKRYERSKDAYSEEQ